MRQGGQRGAAVRSGDGGGAEVAGGTSATRGIISNTRLRRGRAVVQRVAHQPPPAARLRRRSHVQPQRVRPKRRRVSMSQWRRSVVKYGGGGQGQSDQAVKLFQRLHPTSTIAKRSTIPVSGSPYRRLEKLVLPSIFDTILSSLMI